MDGMGEVVERFRVGELLGKGSHGETFRGVDEETGQEVAIKRLRLEKLNDWKVVELFEREARVLEGLEHRRIPKYVDYQVDGETGQAVLVQELAPGEPLDRVLAGGRRFGEEEALGIAEQVLDVLVYLSEQRPVIVHRDIKPGNLIYDGERVAVVDFGTVREAVGQSGGGSTVAGTFGYMAPEQLYGEASAASDIYALGMTVVHLVTGRRPEDLPRKGMRPAFREFAKISPGFGRILDQMIEPDVDRRVGSPEACLAEVRRLRAGEIIMAQETEVAVNPGGELFTTLEFTQLDVGKWEISYEQRSGVRASVEAAIMGGVMIFAGIFFLIWLPGPLKLLGLMVLAIGALLAFIFRSVEADDGAVKKKAALSTSLDLVMLITEGFGPGQNVLAGQGDRLHATVRYLPGTQSEVALEFPEGTRRLDGLRDKDAGTLAQLLRESGVHVLERST